MVDCRYGFGKQVDSTYHETLIRVEKVLNAHGFGVYSRINMGDVFSEGEKVPYRHYIILGACHPNFARQAFAADPNIGLLLPCNIIIYETLDGEVFVMAKDPVHMMDLLNAPAAIEAASKVRCEIEALIDEL
jgi:uncharacterized protein (DUF302 family)